MRNRNTMASLERLIRRDSPEWHAEAAKVAAAKNAAGHAPHGEPWTPAQVLMLALRLGLDELGNRYHNQ